MCAGILDPTRKCNCTEIKGEKTSSRGRIRNTAETIAEVRSQIKKKDIFDCFYYSICATDLVDNSIFFLKNKENEPKYRDQNIQEAENSNALNPL